MLRGPGVLIDGDMIMTGRLIVSAVAASLSLLARDLEALRLLEILLLRDRDLDRERDSL